MRPTLRVALCMSWRLSRHRKARTSADAQVTEASSFRSSGTTRSVTVSPSISLCCWECAGDESARDQPTPQGLETFPRHSNFPMLLDSRLSSLVSQHPQPPMSSTTNAPICSTYNAGGYGAISPFEFSTSIRGPSRWVPSSPSMTLKRRNRPTLS